MNEGAKVAEWRQKQAGEHLKDWTWLLQQPRGRRWLRYIIGDPSYCGADASTHRLDARETDRRNGMRDIGLALRQAAQNADFEMYDRMLGEGANDARAYLLALRSDNEPERR